MFATLASSIGGARHWFRSVVVYLRAGWPSGCRSATLIMFVLLTFSAVAHGQVTTTYIYSDPQGTPIAEADSGGTLISSFDYSPYGQQVLGVEADGPGYTSHVMDSETELVYMQGRYYDPVTTRFIGRDPEHVIPGDSFSANRYLYVNGNPLAHTDPSGRCIEDLCIAEGAAACAATLPCAAAVVGGLGAALSYFGVKAVHNTQQMVDPSHNDVVKPDPTPSQEAVDKIKGDTTPADGQAGKDGVRVGAGGAAGAAAAIDIVKRGVGLNGAGRK